MDTPSAGKDGTAVHGIHHVTCIAGDPQVNVDFYVKTMGLRLVKKSVNQDAPDTYHLFFADAAGTPGTDLTFFPWPNLPPARPGVGLTMEVAFAVAKGSLSYWQKRLKQHGVVCSTVETRFGERALPFRDPHGLAVALVETDRARPFVPWDRSPVPIEHQLRGMHSVRLWERQLMPTEALLTQRMGFIPVDQEGAWRRYGVEGGEPGALIDIKLLPDMPPGRWGVGGVHHVAWRVRDAHEQAAVRKGVETAGLRPTPPIDRFWFKSVYFHEPGGVLFELATDGPGFDVDEDPEHLGEQLILPPWLEQERRNIESRLRPLEHPLLGGAS